MGNLTLIDALNDFLLQLFCSKGNVPHLGHLFFVIRKNTICFYNLSHKSPIKLINIIEYNLAISGTMNTCYDNRKK